jgi:signal transduction histidine kinase
VTVTSEWRLRRAEPLLGGLVGTKLMSDLDIDWWPWLIAGSVALMALLAALLWRRREVPGATPLALLAILVAAVCIAIGAEAATTDPAAGQLWFLARDAMILPGGVLILWFALEYASLERYLPRTVACLLVGSVLVHLALYIPDGGRLLWARLWWDGEVRGELAPLGLAFTAYAFVLFVLATVVLVVLFVRSPAHRLPVALILVAHAVVRIVYPLTALKIVELPNTANILALDFAALMYAAALFRFRLFELVPAARHTIVERMPDAILVLDAGGRIADMNGAARRVLEAFGTVPVGAPIEDALPQSPALVAALRGPTGQQSDVALQAGEGAHVVEVTTIELTDWQGRSIGRLAQIHDITALRAAENRLVEHERALAAATERERLARDLHDSLGQVLGYVGLQAATIRKLARDGRLTDADRRLERLETVASDAQSDVRRTIADLARRSVRADELVVALRSRLDAAERDYGLQTSLVIAPAVHRTDIPPATATHLPRIIDEALMNAIRHGNARHARVSLEVDRGLLSLSVEDDGVGFATTPEVGSGEGQYGLRFMRERAAELAGDLQIESAPGRGTRVSARIPLGEKSTAVPG